MTDDAVVVIAGQAFDQQFRAAWLPIGYAMVDVTH